MVVTVVVKGMVVLGWRSLVPVMMGVGSCDWEGSEGGRGAEEEMELEAE